MPSYFADFIEISPIFPNNRINDPSWLFEANCYESDRTAWIIVSSWRGSAISEFQDILNQFLVSIELHMVIVIKLRKII